MALAALCKQKRALVAPGISEKDRIAPVVPCLLDACLGLHGCHAQTARKLCLGDLYAFVCAPGIERRSLCGHLRGELRCKLFG